ncbi:hypothetical protein STIAU_0008 [Stigmatella aurantiaca DW4/3-1]|uniref:Uncharacterized protein n=1 Tax=Stigmatella aurantiaca (strain DW4/3-1) TaxID=378806 RepID=Q08Q18_STIAD|nr:hypothetical protein STIAU_0008 [Stigmatella aurantiaca DW4/3-1]
MGFLSRRGDTRGARRGQSFVRGLQPRLPPLHPLLEPLARLPQRGQVGADRLGRGAAAIGRGAHTALWLQHLRQLRLVQGDLPAQRGGQEGLQQAARRLGGEFRLALEVHQPAHHVMRGAEGEPMPRHEVIRQRRHGGVLAHQEPPHGLRLDDDVGHQQLHEHQRRPGRLQGGPHRGGGFGADLHAVGEGRALEPHQRVHQEARGLHGLAPDVLQHEGIALLRHDGAGAHQLVRPAQEAIGRACPRLKIRGHPGEERPQQGQPAEHLDHVVPRTHRIQRVAQRALEAQQLRHDGGVDGEGGAHARRCAHGAAVQGVIGPRDPVERPQQLGQDPAQVVAEGGRLGRLQVREGAHQRLRMRHAQPLQLAGQQHALPQHLRQGGPQAHARHGGVDVVAAARHVGRSAHLAAQPGDVLPLIEEVEPTVGRRGWKQLFARGQAVRQLPVERQQARGGLGREDAPAREHHHVGRVDAQQVGKHLRPVGNEVRLVQQLEQNGMGAAREPANGLSAQEAGLGSGSATTSATRAAVSRTMSCGVMRSMWCSSPPPPNTKGCSSTRESTTTETWVACPTGGTPPTA